MAIQAGSQYRYQLLFVVIRPDSPRSYCNVLACDSASPPEKSLPYIGVNIVADMLINASILILASAALYHGSSDSAAIGIDDAYHSLGPIACPAAAILFDLALLAAGQSLPLPARLPGR